MKWYIYIYTCGLVPSSPFDVGNSIFKPYNVQDNYSAGHQECRNAIFHTMYIFSVILHAIDKQDINMILNIY